MGTQQMIFAAVATVIAGLVLLTMFRVQVRGQEASLDAIRYRSAKKSQLSMVEVIERDFNNIGSYMYWNSATNSYTGTDLDPADVIRPGWHDSTAVQGGYRYWFQFLSQTDSLQAPSTIRYEWEPMAGGVATLTDGTQRQLYELRRTVNGALTTSSSLVTEFRVTPLPDASTPIMVNLHDARVFRVRLHSISPLGKAETVEETLFDATYRPVGLAIQDNLN